MVKFGYHCSHEQFPPSLLIKYVQAAEEAGFTAFSSSDHFYPWSEQQGQSGYAWSWLGAALQATDLPGGVVCAPGQRYHPAIIAQAAATLAEMFPQRLWVALGSGQALNEKITGAEWPAKAQRNQRLRECVEIIRALWAGETVTHRGLVEVEETKLYTRPEVPPLIIGPAITPKTAEWVGSWADALITINHPYEKLKEVVEAFRRGGGEGKPMYLKVQLSYSKEKDKALQGAYEQWRTNIFESVLLSDLRLPKQFEVAAKFVKPEDMYDYVRISNEAEQHIEWLQQYLDLGFSELYLHNVNREQEEYIETFGEKVLPALSPSSVVA